MPTPTRKLNPMTDTAQRDEIKALRGELRDERLRSTVFERQYRQACSDHATAMAELASLRERLAKAEGLLHANGTPRFNEAMRRADAAEARALLAESKFAEANRYVNELVDAKATIAKQAQEIAEMREALRELIGLIGRVMAPGYDNIALQEARSLSNTKGSEDDR